MNLQDATAHFCKGYDLPLQLVIAIAKTESNLDQYATRFEPGYRWMWNCETGKPFRRVTTDEAGRASVAAGFPAPPPNKYSVYATDNTEWVGQKTSWGPFQMMGALLRERGYTGAFPAICADPELAAKFACAHLSRLRNRYFDKHGWSGVVAAYNAGRPRKYESGAFINQEYVNKVGKNGAERFVTIR